MLFSKLFTKRANDRNEEVERVHVTCGSWAGISNGKGKYEIYMVYREKDGLVLIYDDMHRDGLNDELEEKRTHKEMILGFDYFRTHTVLEFRKLLSRFSEKGYFSSLDKEKYQALCQMELKHMGIEIEEKHDPLPKIKQLLCGSTIYFGSYFQNDEIHKTPIEWEVLDVKDGTALLISKKALLVSGYCDHEKVYEDFQCLEWSHSLARKVCNQDFYNSAFSDEEKDCLLAKEIEEGGNGFLCKDKVFLLSEKEIRLFMPEGLQRKCEPTKYVKKNGARMGWAGDEAYISWWLLPECSMNYEKVRSVSGESYGQGVIYPKAVFHNGEIGFHGRNVYHSDFVIRPCILLNVRKDEECVPESIDYVVTNFCRKYINTMKEMYVKPELQKWCKEYSAYCAISTHLDLKKLVYDEFMKEAYDFSFFAEYLAKADRGKSIEERLRGNKAELIEGLFVEIRDDYGSNGSLINRSIAEGHIYQLMDAYLRYGENDNLTEEQNSPISYKLKDMSVVNHTDYIKQTHYYCIENRVFFKINRENRSCYRLNLKTKMWEEDVSLLNEIEWGSVVKYIEIEMEDNYEIAVEDSIRKGPEIIVGRHKECDLCIENPMISRRHALIYYNGAHWLVRDLGSTNGVRLNGNTIQVKILSERDKIQIGTCEITFYKEYLAVSNDGKTQTVFLQKKEVLDQELQRRKRSRYIGCLLGGAVGDALGYPIEFLNEEQIFNQFGKAGIQNLEQAGNLAKISDDTQMTLFAANAIICTKSNGHKLEKYLRIAYREWLATQGDNCGIEKETYPRMWIFGDERFHALRAPGNTCVSAIRRFSKDNSVEFAENNSKGCGTVMRAAPFGLLVHHDPIYLRGDDSYAVCRAAKYDAMLTHGHPVAHDASVALALMIYEIVQHRSIGQNSLGEVLSQVCCGSPEVNALMKKAISLARDDSVSDLDAIHTLGEGWVAEEALAIAVFCAVRYQDNFVKAIRTAVNHKGDSDSTGAICGNILGAWLGREIVESSFNIDNLELSDVVIEIADDLYRSVELRVPQLGEDAEWDKKYR